MIPQLNRLPAEERHKLELLAHSQAIYFVFGNRTDGSVILCFTCFCGGKGAGFSNASYGVSDALCRYAVCGGAEGEKRLGSIGPEAVLG